MNKEKNILSYIKVLVLYNSLTYERKGFILRKDFFDRDFIIGKCATVDLENIGFNRFKDSKEVLDFYNNISDKSLMIIHKEYFPEDKISYHPFNTSFTVEDKTLIVSDVKGTITFNRDIYDWYRKDNNISIFIRINNRVILSFEFV